MARVERRGIGAGSLPAEASATCLTCPHVPCATQVMAGNGIELVRTWAFLNGDEDPLTLNGTLSIQPKACFPAGHPA